MTAATLLSRPDVAPATPLLQYKLHGLTIASTLPLPAPSRESDRVDCSIVFSSPPPEIERRFAEQLTLCEVFENGPDTPSASLSADHARDWYRLRFAEGTIATIEASGGRAFIDAGTGDAGTSLMHFLGQVTGFLLRLHGRFALHASCVELGGGAVALAGLSNVGKSTLAAAFAQRGAAVLADNVTVLEGEGSSYVALAGPRRMLLCADAAAALYGSSERFPPVSPFAEKRIVADAPLKNEKVSLGAVIIVDRVKEPLPDVEIRRLSPRESVIELVPNSYGTLFFPPTVRARDLAELSRLADSVPVYAMVMGKDLGAISRVCDVIERLVP